MRVVGGTVFSRIFGFIRDIVSAAAFGASPIWDAFLIAFTLPNVFRRILGEGAFSSAFIPLFAKERQVGGEESAARWAAAILGRVLTLLVIVAVVGVVVILICGSYADQKWAQIAGFSALLFPLVIPVCAVAGMGALLNAYKVFTQPAIVSSVINLFWIAAAGAVLYYGPDLQRGVHWLCWSLLAAGVVQFLLHFWRLRRFNCRVVPRWDLDLGTKMVLQRMAPALLGLGAVQINTVLDRVIASLWAPDGGVSVLFYANRIMQFPLALIGIAVATASFPYMADAASKGDKGALGTYLAKGQWWVLLAGLPAMVVGMVFAGPIIEIVFVRGAFDRAAAARTELALVAYLGGLLFYCGLHPLIKAFHSLGDTATPAKISGSMVVVNVVLNLLLVQFWAELGLALSTAVCGLVSFVWHLWILYRREGVLGLPHR